jgi:hypothetical protein
MPSSNNSTSNGASGSAFNFISKRNNNGRTDRGGKKGKNPTPTQVDETPELMGSFNFGERAAALGVFSPPTIVKSIGKPAANTNVPSTDHPSFNFNKKRGATTVTYGDAQPAEKILKIVNEPK